ncbi:3-hydroxyacyl-[acyl-carrier-protein] dehydratase [Thiothrix caldifontis]|jgi:beta-hydroxyacyl-[acyl carrier protein] dehydratase FabZ|uniref:3-hydroxyacyl-[acyl-carrier-protein] dehydratase FabZ n=1 Tax=Thiothrix caldifontis TaxID=525918 RepID=A0A1H4CIU9_9GAMM|nr:3-hydroxyacyl-ACP dehydratase FabZ [Thiothrix caldifontis]SEA60243.1 3-hydroxyacyl-[acyl-carrier-protein] dehydratase [Thiothrix caldifontis]
MGTMNVEKIRNYLPHRYPFLLVDRVLEYEVGKSLTAIKNVTVNEPWVNGHFPHQPIMPGVLIIEALAQATGLLGFRTMGEEPQNDTLYLLVAVDKARFKQAVVPGDQLVMKVELVKRKGIMWVFNAEARVDGKLAVSAELMCAAKKETVA